MEGGAYRFFLAGAFKTIVPVLGYLIRWLAANVLDRQRGLHKRVCLGFVLPMPAWQGTADLLTPAPHDTARFFRT